MGTLRKVQVDPLRPVEVSPADFLELMRRSSPDTVIASFMGPPLFTEQDQKQIRKEHPGIVAFCSGSLPSRVNLADLFRQGLLQAAVVSIYPSPKWSSAKTEEMGFDQLYLVANAKNFLTVLRQTSGSPI
jgi:hypothetical protein